MYQRVARSINSLVEAALRDYEGWDTTTPPWFRGEPRRISVSLRPKLFRHEYDELKLLQHFRMKAPSLGLPYIPPRESTDQWLFLAQHVRLPTRLLDWTGGLLIALHFALYPDRGNGAVVWMLNPVQLNRKTIRGFPEDGFPLTWFSRPKLPIRQEMVISANYMLKEIGEDRLSPLSVWRDDRIMKYAERRFENDEGERNKLNANLLSDLGFFDNLALANIRMAWGKNVEGNKFPFAVHPTNIHPRMSSQASRFTIHGEDERGLREMRLGPKVLKQYVIAERSIPNIKAELRMMGISHSSLFPELDGLSDELAEIYRE